MTQFGSFLPEDQFDTTQDMQFSEYPLAPDETAMTNAGSYGFDPMSEPAAPQEDMARLEATRFPQASLGMQGLMSPDEFAQFQQGMQPQEPDFTPSVEPGLREDEWRFSGRAVDSNAALLWDQATGGMEQRREEYLAEEAAKRGAPTLQELEEMSPRQTMTQQIQGMQDMESMQGVVAGSVFGIPLGYRNDPEAERVMERRNFARAVRTGESLPEVTQYFNEQKFPGADPGFIKQISDAWSRGGTNLLLLPERLFVDMPAGAIAYFTDGNYGADRLRASAETARFVSMIGERARNNGAVKQLVLDAVETTPQLVAQIAAAYATGGASAATQLAVFSATGAGQAAASQWAESMRTNMEAGMSATAASVNANRDAVTAFASTFVTEALVGKLLKPFGVGVKFDELTTDAIRRAAGATTVQAMARGGTRGMFAEGVQEFSDQALTDFAVNMYQLDQPEFKKFYEENPNWVMDVFGNAAYAGVVGALVGVPAGVITGITTRNGAAATAAQLDRVIGRLPENSQVRRLMERGDLNVNDVDTVMKWFAKNQAKLAIDNATDNKQMRTLGAALNMDGIETQTLQDIILRGNNDGAVTATLRGATRGIGKFGSMQFVVTPAMAADEMVRRNLMSGRTQEQVQTRQATISEGESGRFVMFEEDSVDDAAERFVQENPVVASRLANAEFISRRMAESLMNPSVREEMVNTGYFESRKNRDEFHALVKRYVERQQAEMDPRRLQEKIDNQRRGAEAQVIAELNGLTAEEVARVTAGVSPRKARIVSQVMQEAEQQAAMPVSADATVEERVRRMEDRQFVEAVRAREPGRAATAAERAQAAPEVVSARRARNAEAELRAKFERDLAAAIDVAWAKRQVEFYIEAIEQRGADGRMEEQVALDLLTAVELPANAETAEITREFVEQQMREAGATDEDVADVREAARRRAKTLEEDFRRSAREEAIGILDEAEQQAKNADPNYIVSMPDAAEILMNEASDDTKQDIADVLASGRSLGLVFLEAMDLPEASAGDVDAAELRLRGMLDNIRRTREVTSREPSRVPGIAEVRAERDAALVEEQQRVDAELADLRKQKAMLEAERKPLLEAAWQKKQKGNNKGKLVGWYAQRELAKVAKAEGVDLSIMTRDQYAQYAIEKGLAIDDDILRMAPVLRNAQSIEEYAAMRKSMRASATPEQTKADLAFAKFAERIKKDAPASTTIFPGVRIRSGTADSQTWLYFKVNSGANATGNTHKAYAGFTNPYNSITQERVEQFLQFLQSRGYNGDVKTIQDIDQGSAISDQIVMHGATQADADLALQLSREFFGNELNFLESGMDTEGGSYSQNLAAKIASTIAAQNEQTPAQRRKKRAPMTDAEQAIVNRMREVEEKIAALEKDQASILEQRGIVSQAMPEPEAVDATATFPNQDTGRKRRLIEEARQQIADINDIDINDVKMRYADGKTTLTKQEKRFVNFGKKLGITVVFVQTPGNSTMAGAYKNGVVFLSAQDINRPSAMFAIAMHETVHYLHESNPELFRGLYNALNKRVPRALRELRKSYTARLDQVSRVNAVRRAGLIMLNDENESSRDAVLWVARNDDSPEAALLRANMPDQLAAALDDQDLSALTTPTDDVAAEYRKEFKKRFTSGLRAPLSESQLQQEEIANLAELVMDGAFVTIVGDDGKINIDEVRRLADTKPTISRFAALASAIMDAFAIIPGMTKKARGLNDAQVAALRKFADKPGELASPRLRNVAQQLIAQSLVKMMDAKRGNIPAGEIGANPMSDELAGARIPALDFSIRLAVPDDGRSALFAGEERGLPEVDPAIPSRISKESLDFAIRAIASDDNPTELKLVNNQVESNQQGATRAGFANTEDGRRWYIKHLVERRSDEDFRFLESALPTAQSERDASVRRIQFKGVQKYHLQNELAANLMAESLGMPGVMPIRGFFVTAYEKVLDVQASEVVPGFQTLSSSNTSGESIPWETVMRSAAVSSILVVNDAHSGNITAQGNVFDLGGSLGVPAVASDAYAIPFLSLQTRFRSARDEGTTSETAMQLSALVLNSELMASLYEDGNTVVNGFDPNLTAEMAHTTDFARVINKDRNLLPVARFYANGALKAFARNYAEAQSLSDPTARLQQIRRYLAGALFQGLLYGYNGTAVNLTSEMLQTTESAEGRQNISRVLRDLAQQFSDFAKSGDALAALEAVQLGRGYPFMEPNVASGLRKDIADAVRTRALMMSNFYNTLATLNDGEPAFEEAAVARAKLESIGENINFSIRSFESSGTNRPGLSLPVIDTTTQTLKYPNSQETYKFVWDYVGAGYMKPSEYLRLVQNNSPSGPQYLELATYLSGQLESLGIKVRFVDEASLDELFRQYYSPQKHEYYGSLNTRLQSVQTFVHEALHAVTANAIEDTLGIGVSYAEGPEYVARVAAFARTLPTTRRGVAVRDLCQLWLYVSKAGTDNNSFNYGRWAASRLVLPTTFRGYDELAARNPYAARSVQYGVSNLDEFVAQAFSNQDMVDYLKSIKLPKTAAFESFSNAWELFKDIVSRVFGFTSLPLQGEETAFDRLVAIVPDIMEGNVTARARQARNDDLGGIPLADETMLKFRTSAQQVEAVPLRKVSQNRLPSFPTAGPYIPAQTDLLTGPELFARIRSTWNVDPSLQRFSKWTVYPEDRVLDARFQPTSLPEFSIRRIPQEVIDTAGVENSIAAAQSQKFKSIRDFKLVIQKQVRDAATRNNTTVHDRDSAVIDEYITAVAISDAKYALGMKNNAVGWYDEKVKKALAIMSLVYPELNADERAQFVMKMALAITSNSMEVSENFRLAARAYDAYKRTGKLPTNIGSGQTGKVMDESFARFNDLVKKKGFDWVMNFSNTMYTVREIFNMTGKRVNGESVNQVVYGAAIFGPKIGNGFFANLNGKYEQLTMDRWFMRTWGRWIGLLVDNNRALAESQREELRNSLLGLTEGRKGSRKATKQGKRTLDFIGSEIGEDLVKFVNTSMSNARLTEIAGKIARRSSKQEFRDAMERLPSGDLIRRQSNTHTKTLDGSIETPRNPATRNRIRRVMGIVLAELQKTNPALTMADLQALYWYPEKRLYDTAKVQDDGSMQYETGGLPDYEQAAIAFARSRKIPESDINAAIKQVDAQRRSVVSVRRAAGGRRNAARRGGRVQEEPRKPLDFALRNEPSTYEPASAADADSVINMAVRSGGVRTEVEDRLGALGRAWMGTARQLASRVVPSAIAVEESDDISIVTEPADISPFWKFIAAPINLAIGSKNPEVISVVEDMINMDIERNLTTKSRQEEANAVWESIPPDERDSEEFSRYMDAYHPPETIDTNQEFQSKSQAWRNALKWFKEREEVRRQEIIDTKRDSIRAMLKRDNSSRLVNRASQYGLTWEVVRNERGRKMIQTPDGMITIDQAREALVETMIPDNWGRQYAHFFHWFNGDFKLIGYAADGTRTILGSAITEPEAYEKLYAFKRANPGVYQRLVAEPAVRIDPDDAVRLSDAQRRRLEKMLADATGAYRDEVSDAMRGIVASKTSKRPFYAPLMERTGAGGFVTDFMSVWNMSERLHNRWRMGGDMVRKLTPRIESIRRNTPGWGDYLAESMRHTLFTAPTMTEAAIDSMIRAIPIFGKIVSPFPTRRWLGSIRALNYARQLLTVRQQVVNSFQPLQTIYPILGEQGMMEAVAFYNSDEGKLVLRKHGFFDGSARFREGDEGAIGGEIMDFVSTMNDKIYRSTNENFNPSSEARNQNFAFVAMYHHAKYRLGMDDAEAVRYGRVYGNVYTQFYYTKANIPWLLRGPIASTTLQYRRFAINTTGLLVNEFQRGNYSGVARYMATMSMLGGLQASIGLSAASLIRSLYLGDKEGADDLNYKLRAWLKSELGSERMADVAMMGLPAALGIDLSGSISIWQKPFGRNIYEKIGATVAGPTVNTAIQLMTNLTAETAVPMGAGERLGRGLLDSSPAAQQITSLWKLFSGSNEEYDARGRLKYKLDPKEQFLRAMAFRTVNETVWSMEYQRLRIIRNEVDRYANEAATYLAVGDRATAQKVLRTFNSMYPMASMNMGDIERRAKNKMQSRQMPQLARRIDVESGVVARRIADAEGLGDE